MCCTFFLAHTLLGVEVFCVKSFLLLFIQVHRSDGAHVRTSAAKARVTGNSAVLVAASPSTATGASSWLTTATIACKFLCELPPAHRPPSLSPHPPCLVPAPTRAIKSSSLPQLLRVVCGALWRELRRALLPQRLLCAETCHAHRTCPPVNRPRSRCLRHARLPRRLQRLLRVWPTSPQQEHGRLTVAMLALRAGFSSTNLLLSRYNERERLKRPRNVLDPTLHSRSKAFSARKTIACALGTNKGVERRGGLQRMQPLGDITSVAACGGCLRHVPRYCSTFGLGCADGNARGQ
jgi:hypothetical protein